MVPHSTAGQSCSQSHLCYKYLQFCCCCFQRRISSTRFLIRLFMRDERWSIISSTIWDGSRTSTYDKHLNSTIILSLSSPPLQRSPDINTIHTQTTVIFCCLIDEATQQMDIPTSVKFRSDKRTIYKWSMQVAPAIVYECELLFYCSLWSLGKKMASISFWHQDGDCEVRDVLSRSFRGPVTSAEVIR
jgi:hypothetical protein